MSDKNDTNESLEEGQEALPPGDAEPTEVTEVTEVTEATEATGGENMIHKAQNASGKLMSFSAPAAYFLGAALFLVMALSISNKVSQVDDMLNALTKRAVSMNSAIASFEELNITIQDMGAIQDEFLDQQNLMLIAVNEIKTQIPAETAFKVAAENAVVGSGAAWSVVADFADRPPKAAGVVVTDDGAGGTAIADYLTSSKFI